MHLDVELHRRLHRPTKPTRYEPIPLVDSVKRINSVLNTILDLSYHVYLTGDREVAEHMIDLAEEGEYLVHQLLMHISMITRDAEDAVNAVSVFKYGQAVEKMLDASFDIAYISLTGHIISPEARNALQYFSTQTVTRFKARHSNNVERLEKEFAVDVLLIVRDGKIYHGRSIAPGDTIYVRGLTDNLNRLLLASGYEELYEEEPKDNELRDVAERINNVKDTVNAMIDLAHLTLLSGDPSLASLIEETEIFVDYYHIETLKRILAMKGLGDVTLLSLKWLVSRLEDIADACRILTQIPLMDPELRTVFKLAAEESEEQTTVHVLGKGVTLAELNDVLSEYGAYVAAVKRGDRWSIAAKPLLERMVLNKGDVIVVVYNKQFEKDVLSYLP